MKGEPREWVVSRTAVSLLLAAEERWGPPFIHFSGEQAKKEGKTGGKSRRESGGGKSSGCVLSSELWVYFEVLLGRKLFS